MAVYWVDGSSNPIGSPVNINPSPVTDNNSTWTTITGTAVAPAGAATVTPTFASGTSGNGQVHYIDDVSITTGSGGGTSNTIRYGYAAGGDSLSITQDITNSGAPEFTYNLPGGVVYTKRATGNVWSYPNIHGDVTATADQTGAKQGVTTIYDPYGNLNTGTLPDNVTGNYDFGWLGQDERGLEHTAGLQPTIEMGARLYNPLLGRFEAVDAIEGGTSTNDYGYVADPVDSSDLSGQGHCFMWEKNCHANGFTKWVIDNRGTLATIAASIACAATAESGPAACYWAQSAAYGVRVQQRGIKNIKANLADAALTLATMALVKLPADSAEAKEVMTGAGGSEHMVHGQYNSWVIRTAINYATMGAISGAGYLGDLIHSRGEH